MDPLPKDKSAPGGLLRYTTRPPKPQEFEMFGIPKRMDNACEVVITVHETSSSPSPPSAPRRAYLPRIKTSGLSRSTTPPSYLPPPPLRSLTASARSQTSSPSRVRGNSAPSVQSPVMRSMFPRYNPQVSLAKQHYYPGRERNPRMPNVRPSLGGSSSRTTSISSREDTRSSSCSRPSVGVSRGLPAPESDSHQSCHRSEPEPALSSPEELLDLWSVANGQGSQEAATTYTLRLSWYVIFSWQTSVSSLS